MHHFLGCIVDAPQNLLFLQDNFFGKTNANENSKDKDHINFLIVEQSKNATN